MGADKSFLNAEGMWYGGDLPVQNEYLLDRAATVLFSGKRAATRPAAKKA